MTRTDVPQHDGETYHLRDDASAAPTPSRDAASGAERSGHGNAPRHARGLSHGGHVAALRGLLTGAAAWLITLAPVAASSRAGLAARAAAAVALVGVIFGAGFVSGVGPYLASNHRLARHSGITVTLAASASAWLLASRAGVLLAFDPVRGFLGTLAWAAYAIAWWHPWRVPASSLEAAPPGATTGLGPRRRPPRLALFIAAFGTLAGFACLALAMRIEEPARRLFAQALGVVAAVALIASAANIAARMGGELRAGDRRRSQGESRAVRSVVLFLVVVAAAILIERLP